MECRRQKAGCGGTGGKENLCRRVLLLDRVTVYLNGDGVNVWCPAERVLFLDCEFCVFSNGDVLKCDVATKDK